MPFATTVTFNDSVATLSETFDNRWKAEKYAKNVSENGAVIVVDGSTTVYIPASRIHQVTITESE